MVEKATIIYFPKKCPCCKQPAELIRKFSGAWWYECPTHGRLFFELQRARRGVGRWRWRTRRKAK